MWMFKNTKINRYARNPRKRIRESLKTASVTA